MLFIFGGDLNRIEVGNWEGVRERVKELGGKTIVRVLGKMNLVNDETFDLLPYHWLSYCVSDDL